MKTIERPAMASLIEIWIDGSRGFSTRPSSRDRHAHRVQSVSHTAWTRGSLAQAPSPHLYEREPLGNLPCCKDCRQDWKTTRTGQLPGGALEVN